MNSFEIIARLVGAGYPLSLIATQSGVPYRHIYNRHAGITTSELEEKNLRKLQRFAFRQPCFDGVEE